MHTTSKHLRDVRFCHTLLVWCAELLTHQASSRLSREGRRFVIDLIGKTDHRQLIHLAFPAEGARHR
jgi:hypothetical protein